MTLPADHPIRFWQALRFWLKLGFISFGGPAGQIALMHHELVERRRWISERRFLHALNYCMVLPGPEAQQLATYIGWLMHRTRGDLVAGGLFVLPSLLMLIALSWIYIAYGHLPVVEGLFYGIKPAVCAIVLQAAHRIGGRALKNRVLWAIAALSFVAIFAFNLPFPLIVLLAAGVGAVGGHLCPEYFQAGGGHGAASKTSKAPNTSKASQTPQACATSANHAEIQRPLMDDDTPTPPHARFTWPRFAKVAVVGLLAWMVPMAALVASLGTEHLLTHMSWFFTKAALLTFGGAYAVLPYVYQGAVVGHDWLTPLQMMDGLALGETTPGPLIMVVTFVGFVGGYAKAALGADHLFLSGAVAACLVTWFTFLPSFVFILLGGPFIETTHNNLKFTAPLTAITAAVVGVIVNLALFFGYHVLWPHGLNGLTGLTNTQGFSSVGNCLSQMVTTVDWVAALISVGACVALFHFKRNVIHVIAACAVLGWLLKAM